MTDELHNHIAGMVCETDEPGKPADVTARYLIRKHGCYYRPNSHGYTGSAIRAGRYTLADAIDITHPNGPDGPRDGMFYMHEDEINDDDWKAYQALAAALAEQTATLADLQVSHGILLRLNAAEITAGAHEHRRAEAAEARVTELTAQKRAAFDHGYVIACCNIQGLHDEPGIACDVLGELGVTKAGIKAMKLSAHDAANLRKIRKARKDDPVGK